MSLSEHYHDLERSYKNLEKAYEQALQRVHDLEAHRDTLQHLLTEANARFDRMCEMIANQAALRPAPPVILPECPPGFTMVSTGCAAPGNPRG